MSEVVSIGLLRPYPRNPRNGDIDAIAESLRAHGQVGTLVVNKPTMEILGGNHTYMAALQIGMTEMAVSYVEVDEGQAARLVLALNRTHDRGWVDEGQLAALLEELSADGTGFVGTGYDADAYDDLLARLGRIAEMPIAAFAGDYAPEDGTRDEREAAAPEAGGAVLREVYMRYTVEDHLALVAAVQQLRDAWQVESAAAAMLRAVVEAAAALPA